MAWAMAHPVAYPMAHPKFCRFYKHNQKKSQTRAKAYKVKQTNTRTKKQIYRKIRKELVNFVSKKFCYFSLVVVVVVISKGRQYSVLYRKDPPLE